MPEGPQQSHGSPPRAPPARGRILFISSNDGVAWGGSEELWGRAALRMVRAGWRVSACVRHWPSPAPMVVELGRAGVELIFRRDPGLLVRGVRRLRRALTGRATSQFAVGLGRGSFDLVVVSNGGTVPTAIDAMAICRSGFPYVNICQANRDEFFVDDEQLDAISCYVKSARAMFFVSDANRRLFESQIAMRLDNATIVRNPYAVNHDNELAPTVSGSARSIRFACVGRLHPPSKGQDLLLQALSSPDWQRRDWTLTLAGEGPYRAYLDRFAAMLGIVDRVRFAGQVANMEAFWRDHDVLVLPSRYEGMPLALVEAMLCGRVAVTTRVAGAPEIVVDSQNGFMADAVSVTGVLDALERAYAARSNWPEIGARARATARAFATADPVGKFVEQIEAMAVMPDVARGADA